MKLVDSFKWVLATQTARGSDSSAFGFSEPSKETLNYYFIFFLHFVFNYPTVSNNSQTSLAISWLSESPAVKDTKWLIRSEIWYILFPRISLNLGKQLCYALTFYWAHLWMTREAIVCNRKLIRNSMNELFGSEFYDRHSVACFIPNSKKNWELWTVWKKLGLTQCVRYLTHPAARHWSRGIALHFRIRLLLWPDATCVRLPTKEAKKNSELMP